MSALMLILPHQMLARRGVRELDLALIVACLFAAAWLCTQIPTCTEECMQAAVAVQISRRQSLDLATKMSTI